MEHQDFSFDKLRMSLQFLLSRKKISEGGTLQAGPGPPWCGCHPISGSENQWVLKQATGHRGSTAWCSPHLNTVEDAQAAVVAAPVSAGARAQPTSSLRGERGWWYRIAPPLLGNDTPPNTMTLPTCGHWTRTANMLLMGIVEEPSWGWRT